MTVRAIKADGNQWHYRFLGTAWFLRRGSVTLNKYLFALCTTHYVTIRFC